MQSKRQDELRRDWRRGAALGRATQWLLIAPIRLYQRFVSPLLPPSCRYSPTCSHYCIEAVQRHGAFMGTALCAWRLLRCNPWGGHGRDEVPPRTLGRGEN